MVFSIGEMGLALIIYASCFAVVHGVLAYVVLESFRVIGPLAIIAFDLLGGAALFFCVLFGWDALVRRRRDRDVRSDPP